jgi:hypothetical protein
MAIVDHQLAAGSARAEPAVPFTNRDRVGFSQGDGLEAKLCFPAAISLGNYPDHLLNLRMTDAVIYRRIVGS